MLKQKRRKYELTDDESRQFAIILNLVADYIRMSLLDRLDDAERAAVELAEYGYLIRSTKTNGGAS
jgi:hypothetical protein